MGEDGIGVNVGERVATSGDASGGGMIVSLEGLVFSCLGVSTFELDRADVNESGL